MFVWRGHHGAVEDGRRRWRCCRCSDLLADAQVSVSEEAIALAFALRCEVRQRAGRGWRSATRAGGERDEKCREENIGERGADLHDASSARRWDARTLGRRRGRVKRGAGPQGDGAFPRARTSLAMGRRTWGPLP